MTLKLTPKELIKPVISHNSAQPGAQHLLLSCFPSLLSLYKTEVSLCAAHRFIDTLSLKGEA